MRFALGLACLVLAACSATRRRAREFDGATALTYVERQLGFGPRIPGTAGHEQAGDWLLATLRARADTVIVQEWTQQTRRGERLRLRNFLARFRSDAVERVLYLAHWDTRPRADQSANLAAQRMPVPGANDGASGVAVLLGVADALQASSPVLGVDLLFVDGEDYGDFSDSTETLMGSRYFAAHQPVGYPPLFAVLFDMVGDKDLQIYQEGNSAAFAPEVVQRVWRTASELGYDRYFIPGVGYTITDDHVALQQAGIHAIDVVDFYYGGPDNRYWHTTEDTIDKVAAASLQVVGDVAVALVRQ
ncbi:MAG: M28 family peptidase [Gemmatimonadetes bacterium]|nr:M28 family peptidase [Gemmatimonadota bacterium]